MKDLTDYELDKRSDPNIPKWVYFAVFYGVIAVFAWIVVLFSIPVVVALGRDGAGDLVMSDTAMLKGHD